jgi:hypothetical protein
MLPLLVQHVNLVKLAWGLSHTRVQRCTQSKIQEGEGSSNFCQNPLEGVHALWIKYQGAHCFVFYCFYINNYVKNLPGGPFDIAPYPLTPLLLIFARVILLTRNRQTDRQTDRQTGRQTDKEKEMKRKTRKVRIENLLSTRICK